MGGSGRICLPTNSHLGQSGGEVTGLPLKENHPDCSGVAQHALVLGSSDHVQSDPTEPAQPVDTAFQSDPSQKSDTSKSPCMAHRATAIEEQGFSEAVAARIEAPQRGSTRSLYEAKWTIFTKGKKSYASSKQDLQGQTEVKFQADKRGRVRQYGQQLKSVYSKFLILMDLNLTFKKLLFVKIVWQSCISNVQREERRYPKAN